MENEKAIERLAAKILKSQGIDFETTARAGGWTNHVRIGANTVLRLSPTPGTDRIRREIRLATALPPQVGYPKVVAWGVSEGHEWSLSERVEGVDLSDAWATLDWSQRTDALEQAFAIAQAVHDFDGRARDFKLPRVPWYSNFDRGEDFALLESLAQRKLLNNSQVEALQRLLDEFFAALDSAERVLCHGDITMYNMLWGEGRITALLDFEHAALLPVQVDLNLLLRFVVSTEGVSDVQGESPVPQSVLKRAAQLAAAALSGQGGVALLLGVAALISLKRLDIWWNNLSTKNEYEQWEPHRSLVSLADGQGGFFAPLLRLL